MHIDQERVEAQSRAYEEWFLDGSEDAAFGQLPRFLDSGYLNGYIAGLRKLPVNEDGTIRHYNPRQHFSMGRIDSPDPCHCGEF